MYILIYYDFFKTDLKNKDKNGTILFKMIDVFFCIIIVIICYSSWLFCYYLEKLYPGRFRTAYFQWYYASAKKPSRATISVLKPTLENEDTKTVTSVLSSLSGFSNTIAPTDNGSTPTKSSTTGNFMFT